MPISPEDIERITRAVVSRLGSKHESAELAEQAPAEETIVDTPQMAGSPARQSMPDSELPEVTPMTAASTPHLSHPEIEPTASDRSRVIVATFGRNRPGVVAALTAVLAEHNCDIADITQKILQEFFSMIMIIDLSNCTVDLTTLREKFNDIESRLGVSIVAQHEDVFRAMHRI